MHGHGRGTRSLQALDRNQSPRSDPSKQSDQESWSARAISAERRLYQCEQDIKLADTTTKMKTAALSQANSARDDLVSRLREEVANLRRENTKLESARWEACTELEVMRASAEMGQKQLKTAQRQLKEALAVREQHQLTIAALHQQIDRAERPQQEPVSRGFLSGKDVPRLDLRSQHHHTLHSREKHHAREESWRSVTTDESNESNEALSEREDKWHAERVQLQREVRKLRKKVAGQEEQIGMVQDQLSAKQGELSNAQRLSGAIGTTASRQIQLLRAELDRMRSCVEQMRQEHRELVAAQSEALGSVCEDERINSARNEQRLDEMSRHNDAVRRKVCELHADLASANEHRNLLIQDTQEACNVERAKVDLMMRKLQLFALSRSEAVLARALLMSTAAAWIRWIRVTAASKLLRAEMGSARAERQIRECSEHKIDLEEREKLLRLSRVSMHCSVLPCYTQALQLVIYRWRVECVKYGAAAAAQHYKSFKQMIEALQQSSPKRSPSPKRLPRVSERVLEREVCVYVFVFVCGSL